MEWNAFQMRRRDLENVFYVHSLSLTLLA